MGILKFAFKTYLHFWRSSDTPLWIIFRRFIHQLKFTLGKSPKRPKQQDFSCRWAYPLNGKWNNGLSVKNISSQLSELWVMNTCWKESSKRVFLVTVILMCWGIDSCWRKREKSEALGERMLFQHDNTCQSHESFEIQYTYTYYTE